MSTKRFSSKSFSVIIPLICILISFVLISLGIKAESVDAESAKQWWWIISPSLSGKLLTKLGEITFVLGVFHAVFDYFVTRKLVEESTKAAVQSERVAESGIEDFRYDSEDVDYVQAIIGSSDLVIGFHHSSRIIATYSSYFVKRAQLGRKTTFIALGSPSAAITYLDQRRGKAIDVDKKLEELNFHIAEIKRKSGVGDCIELFNHGAVLSYSFVYTGQYIWVKPNRNSNGYETVPALKVAAGSPLFEFFGRDIMEFITEVKGPKIEIPLLAKVSSLFRATSGERQNNVIEESNRKD
ncbi:MAG: hypothetical protein JNL64_04795 [Blastocatellia bacterium]|nr:hypothetical protein [Blastocatellia bacterium]